MSDHHKATCQTNGHIFGAFNICIFCDAPKPAIVESRCGSCLYFAPQQDEPDFGDCLWAGPVPVWVADANRHDGMMATDGKNCRTFVQRAA